MKKKIYSSSLFPLFQNFFPSKTIEVFFPTFLPLFYSNFLIIFPKSKLCYSEKIKNPKNRKQISILFFDFFRKIEKKFFQ